jgi:hypothetical protein
MEFRRKICEKIAGIPAISMVRSGTVYHIFLQKAINGKKKKIA